MPNVDIEIAARRYQIACRAGEEEHLREVAALVDAKARDAAGALGSLGETRQLLIAALLLADQLSERNGGTAEPVSPLPSAGSAAPRDPDSDAGAVADALERLADRMESLAERLETRAANP